MLNRISNGWELMKASARALDEDRELLVFPLASGFATLIVIATFVLPLFVGGGMTKLVETNSSRALGMVILWLFYFVLYSATIFFNTALVGAALIRLDGGNPTLGDGMRIATSRLRTILGYAAISATVGLLLKAIKKRTGLLQRWVASLAGVTWSLATFLVVPVLAATGVGPIDALKQSAKLFKRTWGEEVVGAGGIRAISVLVGVGLVLLAAPCVNFAAGTHNTVLLAVVVAVFAVALLALILVSSALHGIYTAALYRFATTGEPSFGFQSEALQSAFRERSRRSRR